ncbi:MAG: putative toxin-antitoxin system toxin component, PIN family [Chloroflexi bacterium]|nr:putative toxin-antitoxin system toxin component, PIN family [Chloroflexota bacterium]
MNDRLPQIVIDTNVIYSALRSSRGASYQLIKLIGKEKFKINLSVPLITEYEEILLRHLNDFPTMHEIDIVKFLNYICSVARLHDIFYLWRPFLPDPDDDLVLEAAANSSCDFIVTFNKRDFVGSERFGLRVLTPQEFLDEIGAVA